MKPSQESYVPSCPNFIVEFAPGDFSSFLKSKKTFAAGDFLTSFEGLTRAPKTYTSVQCGREPDDHVELNSDLAYINHSCEPNVALDLSSSDPSKWHIRALEPIAVGSPITFFYPSTEWDMVQAFDCECGSAACLGRIKGARYLPKEELIARKWVNSWILELVDERDAHGYGRTIDGEAMAGRQRVSLSKEEKRCLSCSYGFSVDGEENLCGCKPIVGA